MFTRLFFRPHWSALAAALVVLACAPVQAQSQVPPKRAVTAPQNLERAVTHQSQRRTNLARWVQLATQYRNDRDGLRRALAAERIRPFVQRICFVSGSFEPVVECENLQEFLARTLRLQPHDQALMNLAFNDVWEQLGGGLGGGDLLYCGGSPSSSLTHVRAHGQPPQQAVVSERQRGPAGPSKADAGRMVDNCRAAQMAGIRNGLGTLYTPGSPGYRRAVRNAQSFLSAVGESCGAEVPRPFGQEQIATGGKRRIDSVEDAGATVAKLTNVVVQAGDTAISAAQCKAGAGGCAEAAAKAAALVVGGTATADGLTNNPSGAISTAADLVDVAMAVAAFLAEAGIAGTSATVAAGPVFGAVLPVIAAAAGGLASGKLYNKFVVEPIFGGIRDAAADYVGDRQFQGAAAPQRELRELRAPSGARIGTQRPAPEGGKPTCEQMAQRAAGFNSYCSQPGNDWRSYDCMLFVARLNGCADPGVVRPAHGRDYECSRPESAAEERRAACEQTETLRGWLSGPGLGGTGHTGRTTGGAPDRCGIAAASPVDLDRRMRAQVCQRVTTDDPTGFCRDLARSGRR
jgi:hypothetical protein